MVLILEELRQACIKNNIDILVMGDDHKGRFDFLKKHNIDVTYLSRTPNISTTTLIKNITQSKE